MTKLGKRRLTQHPAVGSVMVEGSAVLLDERSGSLHLLDPLASAIWTCLDGSCTVDELVSDVAAAFEEEQSVVRGDVVQLIENFVEKDLVEEGRGG